jgi:LPS-assembly protein
MRVFRVKPIALLLSCICGCAGAADDSAIGFKTGEGGLRLKLQPSFIRIPPGNKDQVPLFVDADDIQGHQDQEIEAQGAVRLRRRGQAIYADWLRYDKPADEVTAQGNIRLEQRGDVLEGTSLQYKLDTERGALEKPKYQVRVNAANGRGEGDRLLFEGQNKYRVLGGSYTSCDLDNEDWYLRAKDLEIDKERQIGTARNASVVFLGAPILYTPYLSFSLDRQRKSGFLPPTFGNTGNSGYEFSIPYYWNIAPNRDATITPRVMSKRGEMLNTELRYLDPNYSGTLSYEILPQDRVKNDAARSVLNLQHYQNWSNGWNGHLNIQKVSDDTYFTDLSTQIAATSQSVLPREGELGKNGTWWNDGTWGVAALIQRWQTLQTDPLNPLTPPYSRSQVKLTAAKQNAGFTDLDFFGSAVQFTHPSLLNGQRAVAYPSLSIPLQSSFAYLTPKIGAHLTHYDLDQTNTAISDQNRTLPIFSTESGMVFERGMMLSGQNLLQTLEPKIYYLYIPTRRQNQLPVFDTAQKDINFASLYAENQFSGDDRINDANQVTMGITSRLLQKDSGIERLRVGVAQRFYFKSQEVALPGIAPRDSTNSDLLAALSGTVAPHWTADVGWQYTTDSSQTQRANAGTRFQPEPGKVLNLSYRYTNSALITPSQPVGAPAAPTQPQTALRQVDLSSQWPLYGRLSGVARWNYSIQDSRLLEGLAGLEYNGGCWAFRVVAHRFATTFTTQVSSIFMQLELNGVSKLGSNPLELLRRNIGGYSRLDLQSTRPDDMFPGR